MQNLNVSFDLWKGESDAQPYIPDMVEKMKEDRVCAISRDQGALVVDVKEETDTKGDPAMHDPEIRRSVPLYIQQTLQRSYERMKDYRSGSAHLCGR